MAKKENSLSAEWAPAQPSGDQNLWRYMSLAKYVSMLVTGSLYFARAAPAADLLGDDFEGALGKGEGRTQYRAPRSLCGKTAPREKVFINSWHMQRFELASMWKTYGGLGEAVAVRSTFARLRRGLPKYITVGRVEYIVYTESNPKLSTDEMRRYFTKRRSFERRNVSMGLRPRELGNPTPQLRVD
jgi:hypothetical protein